MNSREHLTKPEFASRMQAEALAAPAAPAGTPGAELTLSCTGREDLDPIAVVQSFYPMVEALARARSHNPDSPPHLATVTKAN